MNRTFETFWRRRERGLALVEALVGCVLLGTLLVSLLLAKGRMTVQSARSRRRVEACAILDRQLGQWWGDRADFPRKSAGEVPESGGWRWRTRTLTSAEAEALTGEIVAVEVFAPRQTDTAPLARADLLLPGENGS